MLSFESYKNLILIGSYNDINIFDSKSKFELI
jgi:hypothetical protein